MTTSINNSVANTILAFHIGRGGQFYNPGHKTFIGEYKIGYFINNLFIGYENQGEISRKIGNRENLRGLYERALEFGSDTSAKDRFERLTGLSFGEEVYYDGNGNEVGLTAAEEATGIGCINIDNEYNTTYTCRLEDCDENELQIIVETNNYVDSDVRAYAKDKLGIE
jgi:hypothetical protein